MSGINNEVNKAKIIANPLLFQLLFGTLYKNKIESVVRELLANAKDASVQQKTKVPIEIHAPQILEPWFSIKDYGIGMDSDTIVDVFGNFGSSTKQNSNKYIGAYGLGAKSCFQMNQFSVSSNKDGINNVYQFFIDKDGAPSNVQLHQGKTKESNGTEIKIAINDANDFQEFQNAIRKYGTWIGHPLKCNSSIKFEKPELEYKEPHFSVTKSDVDSPTVVVGGLIYNFDWHEITGYQYGSSRIVNPVKDSRIIYFANIGDIDFTASREECRYTDKTKAFFLQVNKEVNAWYKDLLKDKTSFWIHQNVADWESSYRGAFDYGFPIISKSFRKWMSTQRDRIYKKYITVDDLFGTDRKVVNWAVAAKKLGMTNKDVAFLDSNNEQALIKLGCDPANIIKFSSLPKRKLGSRKGSRVLYLTDVGGIGHKYIAKVDGKTFNIADSSKFRHRGWHNRNSYDQVIKLMKDGYTITADPSKPCELSGIMKKGLSEYVHVTYCQAVERLAQLGFVKKLVNNANAYPQNHRLLEELGLFKRKHVELKDNFPLLDNHYLSGPWKEHAQVYVRWVLKQKKDALKKEHLQVLKPNGLTVAKKKKIVTN